MSFRAFYGMIVLISIGVIAHSCSESITSRHEQLSIRLRWVKGYEGETEDGVVTGLKWSLSLLGAKLPAGSLAKAVQWQNRSVFDLDLSKVGFSTKGELALTQILNQLKESEEYSRWDSIDLGRFIALTLTCSNYYYAITGAEANYSNFRSKFKFEDKLVAITASGVAKGNRLIEISVGASISSIAFIAHEGRGQVQGQSFAVSEFEIMDFMENGQLRFAIYDSLGKLKTSGDSNVTGAGKPAKCMWCHESGIHLPFISQLNFGGYYTAEEFSAIVKSKMNIVESYRVQLNSEIDFQEKQDHTQAELLYLTFLEPSAARLAEEWDSDLSDVKMDIQALPTHENFEFSFLENILYQRKDVDKLMPYQVVPVADYAREKSFFEPPFPGH